ncbi:MAG: rod shape-determining protein, partial [Planctomycetota bacterium]
DIGYRTAENIKLEIGSAYPMEEEVTMDIKGRDTISGLPRATVMSSEEVREALRGPVEHIANAVKTVLERTVPELASDLLEYGMVMVGGGSLLRGLDKFLAEETGMAVRIAEDPLTAVARGTGILLENLDIYKDVLQNEEVEV